jgi:CubicO group peptidase (beta-lactamase class C family)
MRLFIVSVLLCAFTFSSMASSSMARAQGIEAVDRIAAQHAGKDTPGIAVLVMRNGVVLHMKGYGVADTESGDPVDADTIFDLASVSKQMTALAAMMLIKEGTIRTDMPVADVLHSFRSQPAAFRPVTVGDLIHHISGLQDYLNKDRFAYTQDMTNKDVLHWLGKQPLQWAPGTRFAYSDSGYIALASLIAKVDGKSSLHDVLQARIFAPLGMKATGIVDLPDSALPSKVTRGYSGKNGVFKENTAPTITEGDGNVFSSLRDLALYEKALFQHRFLDRHDTRELFENGSFDDGTPIANGIAGYGFGWFLERSNGSDYAFHSGNWMGTSTYYRRNLTTGLTIILLANGEDFSAAGVADAIEKAVTENRLISQSTSRTEMSAETRSTHP